MGLTRLLAGPASRAPAPVFAVCGAGARQQVAALRLRPDLELVDSPRSATVLLVAGHVSRALLPAVLAVHDQLARPRATVRWSAEEGTDIVEELVAVHGRLMSGALLSEEPSLLDVDPNPWRGVGPYGQGGTGMTGGTPFGRPLAGRADDRDGLTLDQLPLRVGPFFPAWPPGLTVDVMLQGDVVQGATVAQNPFARWPGDEPLPTDDRDPFVRARHGPVLVADLERARVRHHLRWLAEALRVQGLGALGRRALGLALRAGGATPADVRRLRRLVERSRVLTWSTGRTGRLSPHVVGGRGLGPVARAAGIPEDARALDPVYRELGFSPVVQEDGGTAARWRQRLDEIDQSLALASAAGERRTGGDVPLEGPGGASDDALVPALVEGLEWGDAVAAVVSLDLDLEEQARHAVEAPS